LIASKKQKAHNPIPREFSECFYFNGTDPWIDIATVRLTVDLADVPVFGSEMYERATGKACKGTNLS